MKATTGLSIRVGKKKARMKKPKDSIRAGISCACAWRTPMRIIDSSSYGIGIKLNGPGTMFVFATKDSAWFEAGSKATTGTCGRNTAAAATAIFVAQPAIATAINPIYRLGIIHRDGYCTSESDYEKNQSANRISVGNRI